ncbi:MAG: maleylpyruvate isomerase family mycothiol-dependent enzyme [Actinomycetota bacterium]
MSESRDAYRGCRERVFEIITSASEEALRRRVPACPDWTSTDLLAHLVGVAEDFVSGDLAKIGSDEWTKGHLARRSGAEVADTVAEWAAISAQVEQALDQIPPGAASLLIGDNVTHEHDLRGAVERPGARDSDGVWIALDRYVKWFGKRLKDVELPSVVVHAGDRRWQAGVLEPAAEIKGEPFELLRALTGRRTVGEIKSLAWSGDPTPYIDFFSSYPPARNSLSES